MIHLSRMWNDVPFLCLLYFKHVIELHTRRSRPMKSAYGGPGMPPHLSTRVYSLDASQNSSGALEMNSRHMPVYYTHLHLKRYQSGCQLAIIADLRLELASLRSTLSGSISGR